MKYWTVYKHVSPSGKVYVGISSNIKNRWAASGYYYCLSDTAFSRALTKYGWDNFQHIILAEHLSKQEACDMEKELIVYYKAKKISYNITDGGEGFSGTHPKELVQKRVASRVSNSHTDYVVIDQNFNYIVCQTEKEAAEFLRGDQRNIAHVLRQPIGSTFRKHYIWKHVKGTPVDIESIRQQILAALKLRHQKASERTKSISSKMVENSKKARKSLTAEERKQRFGHGEALKGRHHSEETKKKMSIAAKGRDMSRAVAASSAKNRKGVCQTLDNMVINMFNSIHEASQLTGINPTNISECARGKRKTAGGYCWKFKEEEV